MTKLTSFYSLKMSLFNTFYCKNKAAKHIVIHGNITPGSDGRECANRVDSFFYRIYLHIHSGS